MQTHIAKWGNSLAIRLPKSVVEALRLSDREEIALRVENDTLIVTHATPHRKLRAYDLEAALRSITPEQWPDTHWDHSAPAGTEAL